MWWFLHPGHVTITTPLWYATFDIFCVDLVEQTCKYDATYMWDLWVWNKFIKTIPTGLAFLVLLPCMCKQDGNVLSGSSQQRHFCYSERWRFLYRRPGHLHPCQQVTSTGAYTGPAGSGALPRLWPSLVREDDRETRCTVWTGRNHGDNTETIGWQTPLSPESVVI